MSYSILFVDDDQNLLDALKRSLYKSKDLLDVTYSRSAEDALALCSGHGFDFIISDYKMPVMDGLELLGIIKDKYPSMKRILLTGQSRTEISDKADEVAQKYLSKPCAAADIIKILSEL